MDYFSTQAGQNVMENISFQLTRIANALEALAAAWGKEPDKKEESTHGDSYHQ